MSRDILHPELLLLGSGGEFRYRLPQLANQPPIVEQQHHRQQSQMTPVGQLDEPDAGDEADDELADCEIEELPGSVVRYRLKLAIPMAYHRFLIGRQGETRRRLEADTGVEMKVPRMGDSSSPVLLLARERRQLASAKTRVQLIMEEAQQKLPITHFVSLPCPVPDRFVEFREQTLKWCGGDRGVVEAAYQWPNRLHVTSCVLLLLSEQQVALAERALNEFSVVDTVGARPLRVRLRGLEIMNDDPSDARVLYAKVEDPTGRMQALVDALEEKFAGTGCLRRSHHRDSVKLHATLINARYADDADKEGGGRNRGGIDFRHMMEKFGDFDFGEFTVPDIQLSKTGTSVASKEVYYPCVAKLELPQ